MCFKMTYIQLSLLGISARVVQGDSLSLKFQQVLYTPFYFVNGFQVKMKQRYVKKEILRPTSNLNTQLKLF